MHTWNWQTNIKALGLSHASKLKFITSYCLNTVLGTRSHTNYCRYVLNRYFKRCIWWYCSLIVIKTKSHIFTIIVNLFNLELSRYQWLVSEHYFLIRHFTYKKGFKIYLFIVDSNKCIFSNCTYFQNFMAFLSLCKFKNCRSYDYLCLFRCKGYTNFLFMLWSQDS